MAGKAAKELTKDEPKRARDVLDEMSTREKMAADRGYKEYLSEGHSEPLSREDWVRKFYK